MGFFDLFKRKPNLEWLELQQKVRDLLASFDEWGSNYEVTAGSGKGEIRLVLTLEGKRFTPSLSVGNSYPIYTTREWQNFLEAVVDLEILTGAEVDIVQQYKYITAGITIGG